MLQKNNRLVLVQFRGHRSLQGSHIVLTREYCGAQGIPYGDVLADPPEATYEQLGLRVVPRTIVVGPGGIVEKVWSGQLDASEWNEIFSFFSLPGNATSHLSGGAEQAASAP